MTLFVRLLGPVQISHDDQPISMRGYKPVALLAYLLLTRKAHTRQHLVDLLFDGPYDPKASLRGVLSELRKAIGPDFILADRQQIAFNFDQNHWLDVIDFEAGQSDLYRGDFLEGLNVRDAFGFEEWSTFERERLKGVYITILTGRLAANEKSGDDQAVIEVAHKLLGIDNLREAWYRALMRAYARQGQRKTALAQFDLCRQVLQTELGVEPEAKTVALAQAIRQGLVETTKSTTSRPPVPMQNLPPQSTPFIGREAELAEVAQRLANAACRLITLVGPGGMGKTRLALQAATESLALFANGVCFVRLAPIESPEFLITAIAEALNLSFHGAAEPQAQVMDYLQHKECLLVLDNFEHILAGAALVSKIVLAAPGVKLLVTSRERLNLQEEWVYELQGMTFPEVEVAEAPPQSPPEEGKSPVLPLVGGVRGGPTYSALQLFEQRARQAQASFDLSAEYPAVVRICQLVEGMPLGLELAATWINLMPCREIAVEIEQNLDFLTTSLRNVPERHRSLRAVFEHSWQLLTDEEKAVFKKLSVFRGGFTRPAAENISGATLHILMGLVNKSLIQPDYTGRYHIHELLRQFGAEKLTGTGEMEQTRDHHLAFFLKLAEEAEPHLEDSEQVTRLKRLEIEHDNLRAALNWSLIAEDTAELSLRLAGSLALFWNGRSYMSEGREYLSAALARPEAAPRTAARAKALFEAGRLAYEQGDFAAVRALLEESLSIYRELGPAGRLGLAHALITLGNTEDEVGDYTTAFSLLEEALDIMRALEEVSGLARALWHLGWHALRQGDYQQAKPYFEEALPLYRHIGDNYNLSFVLSGLGEAALRQGDYERATALLEESLALRREFDINWGIAASLGTLGWVALRRGDLEQAVTLLGESLTLRREIGDRAGGIAWCLEKLAEIALTKGQRESSPRQNENFQRAARLFGAAAALREPIGSVIDLADQPEYERQVAIVQAQLDKTAFTAAWSEGRVMTQEQAINYALTVELD